MTRLELQGLLEDGGLSPEAEEVVENVLDINPYESEDYDVDCDIEQEAAERLMYIQDACNYLTEQDIGDVSEAISAGERDVSGIAAYYLAREILGY